MRFTSKWEQERKERVEKMAEIIASANTSTHIWNPFITATSTATYPYQTYTKRFNPSAADIGETDADNYRVIYCMPEDIEVGDVLYDEGDKYMGTVVEIDWFGALDSYRFIVNRNNTYFYYTYSVSAQQRVLREVFPAEMTGTATYTFKWDIE